MSVVDEFVANRVLHVRNQLREGTGYDTSKAVKAEGVRLWSRMNATEKREAEARYFVETEQVFRTRPR